MTFRREKGANDQILLLADFQEITFRKKKEQNDLKHSSTKVKYYYLWGGDMIMETERRILMQTEPKHLE